MDRREMKGMQMAHLGRIYDSPKGWIVPSESGSGAYLVYKEGEETKCNCPDCQMRKIKCKHQWAVEYFTKESIDEDGNKTIEKVVRMTYTQNWKAYNAAQNNEIRLFDELLKDLVENIEEPEQQTGRPRLSLKEGLFCSIQKVYSQLSSRRAYTLYRNAEERDQIGKVPNYNAINKLLNREEITPLLHHLLLVSSLPLKGIETNFAPDSSGFRTSQFNQYCVEKHNTKKEHKWVKAHILTGTKTNVIASARITEGDSGDSPQFKPMVKEAYEGGFSIEEVEADGAYCSRENYDFVDELGGTAYIPFKSNATGRSRGSRMWNKMYHYFS